MTRPTCKTCRYWRTKQVERIVWQGSCHIRSVPGAWPPRAEDDDCGEHKPIRGELKTAPTVQELATRDTTHYGDHAKQKLWEDIGNTGHYPEWQDEPQT